MQIKSGRGTGHLAGVNKRHQLEAITVAKREMAYVVNQDEESYVLVTANLSIVTSEYAVVWIKLPTSNKHLYIERVWLNWNGGDTNHNRVAFVKLLGGMAEPSANNSAMTPRNLLVGSQNESIVSAYEWDGVGSGMTVASDGVLMGLIYARQGLTEIDLDGAAVVQGNGILGVTVKGEEAGQFSMGLTYWMNERGE